MEERGVAVSGCCSSVAEHGRLRLETPGSTPGGTTFPPKALWTVVSQIYINIIHIVLI